MKIKRGDLALWGSMLGFAVVYPADTGDPWWGLVMGLVVVAVFCVHKSRTA